MVLALTGSDGLGTLKEMPPQTPFSTVDKRLVVVGLLCITLGLIIGFAVGQQTGGSTVTSTNPTNTADQSLVKSSNNLIINQSATLQGTIKTVINSVMSVEGADGQRLEVNISPKVVIYKYQDNTGPSSVSTDVSTIEVDRPVILNLDLLGDQYYATMITYPATPATAN